MLDKNRNAVIENIDFDVRSGNLFFTTRDSRKVIKGVYLIEVINDETSSKICETEEFHGSTNYNVGHEMKIMLFYNSSYIVILTVGDQLVKYNLGTRQSTECNCGIATDLKVLPIFKAEQTTFRQRVLVYKGKLDPQPHVKTLVINRHYVLSKKSWDEIDPGYRIHLCDDKNAVQSTKNIASKVALPLMCFFDKSSGKHKIFNYLGVVSL